tara:strand:- start:273 stop:740 length:468 start_codon:yes stop_codon:yes gene_type:complete
MEKFKLSSKLLKTRIEPFDFREPPVDPGELSIEMYRFMLESGGIGLAANQIGLPHRIFVMYPSIVCYNPSVIFYSQEQTLMHEHCLSYPGKQVRIKRPTDVYVTYQDSVGQFVNRTFDGIHARVFQHELDHLNGVVHLDKASRANIIEAGKVTFH